MQLFHLTLWLYLLMAAHVRTKIVVLNFQYCGVCGVSSYATGAPLNIVRTSAPMPWSYTPESLHTRSSNLYKQVS